jgi:Skp family chaperone for outer membrane proteins
MAAELRDRLAVAAGDRILGIAAIQLVIAAIAEQLVIAVIAIDRVIAQITAQRVIARAAKQIFGKTVAQNAVMAIATLNPKGARAAKDFTMPLKDAKDLHADITKLLIDYKNMQDRTANAEQEQAITVKMDGGKF